MNSDYELAALELAERGWTILPFFLAPENIAALRGEAEQYGREQRFRAAGIGRGSGQAARTDIRSDQILWLNPQEPTPAQEPYWAAMDALRQTLNRELFLSLVSLEAHYAVYEPGAFYRKHVDRFQSSDERMISTTLYLNPGWSEADGGQLRLYSEEAQTEDAAERAEQICERPAGSIPGILRRCAAPCRNSRPVPQRHGSARGSARNPFPLQPDRMVPPPLVTAVLGRLLGC